jgi:hypothetical protein
MLAILDAVRPLSAAGAGGRPMLVALDGICWADEVSNYELHLAHFLHVASVHAALPGWTRMTGLPPIT